MEGKNIIKSFSESNFNKAQGLLQNIFLFLVNFLAKHNSLNAQSLIVSK